MRGLAREAGISHSSISRIEAGTTEPSQATLAALAGVIGTVPATRRLGAYRSELLRSLRVGKGLSQSSMAAAVGVSQGTYSKWESGSQAFSKSVAHDLASVLGADADQSIALTGTCIWSHDECQSRYEQYWQEHSVQDKAGAESKGLVISANICCLDDQPDDGRLLAQVQASRAYWHLVRGHRAEASRLARQALELGNEVGHDMTTGYAVWALARLSIHSTKPRATMVSEIEGLQAVCHERLPAWLPYGGLLEATHFHLTGRHGQADDRLCRLIDDFSLCRDGGQFGQVGEDYWPSVFYSYRLMFALQSGRTSALDRLACGASRLATICRYLVGMYVVASEGKIWSSSATLLYRELQRDAESNGLGFAFRTIVRHADEVRKASLN